jgi:hypothetical protein
VAKADGTMRRGFVIRFASADDGRRESDFLDTMTPYD